MVARDPDLRRIVARTAAAVRWGDSATVAELQRDLRFTALVRHVAEVTAQFPPLTADQRQRLAALLAPHLRGGGTA
jgi:hypothetical protein